MRMNELIIIHFDKCEIANTIVDVVTFVSESKNCFIQIFVLSFRWSKVNNCQRLTSHFKTQCQYVSYLLKICKIFHILMTSYCSLSLIRRKYVNFNHLTPVKFLAVSSWEGWGWLFQEYFSCGNRRHNYLLECVVFYFGK